METRQLKANPGNPRTITPAKLELLKQALAEFGDLSGIVYNVETQRLVGGHQRVKAFAPSSKITITLKHKKPTKTGTVAEGFVTLDGERYAYREVRWDETKEKAANIAANKGAGEWNYSQLASWFSDISDFGFDLDLSMFDSIEVGKVLSRSERAKAKASDDEESEDEAPKGKEKKRVVCPECSHKFVPGWQ